MKIDRGLAVFSVIAFVISAPAAAQDALSLDEILQWVPLADYREVVHYDKAAAERAKAYAAFVECDFPDRYSYYIDESRLPPDLRGHFTSVTYVFLVNTEPAPRPEHYDRPDSKLTEDAKRYMEFILAYRNRDEIRVWRFHDLDPLIKAAVEAGELAETGEKAFGRPIYTYKGVGRGARGSSENAMFAYVTESRELLTARKLESIKQMVDAGYGLALNLTNDEMIGVMVGVFPSLGQSWHMTNFHSMMKTGLMVMIAMDHRSEEIDDFMERMENGELFSVSTYLLGDLITSKSISCYGSDEIDKYSLYHGVNIDYYPDSDERVIAYNKHMRRTEKYEVVGNTEVVTRVYDEELLESLRKVKEYWEMRRMGLKEVKGVRP